MYNEFSYNNSYQDSLKMAPSEMLYGRRFQTPLFWIETENEKCLDLTYCKTLRDKCWRS
jgi:hypothetical protein